VFHPAHIMTFVLVHDFKNGTTKTPRGVKPLHKSSDVRDEVLFKRR
jgi:hypothetical protein